MYHVLHCLNCGCLHTLADLDYANVLRATVLTRQEMRHCDGILTGVNETWACPDCGIVHANSYIKRPRTRKVVGKKGKTLIYEDATYKHEDIALEAYYRYLLRERKGIQGDHRADWYFAIEKLDGKQLFELVPPGYIHLAGGMAVSMIKRFMEDYVEAVHPGDFDAQDELMDKLCMGTVTPSLEEMQATIKEYKDALSTTGNKSERGPCDNPSN